MRMKTGLRHAIEQFRPGIRLTGQQNILLTDLDDTQRGQLESLLNDYGISADPKAAGAYRFAMACPLLSKPAYRPIRSSVSLLEFALLALRVLGMSVR